VAGYQYEVGFPNVFNPVEQQLPEQIYSFRNLPFSFESNFPDLARVALTVSPFFYCAGCGTGETD
jgi:RNA-binding protein YlmH